MNGSLSEAISSNSLDLSAQELLNTIVLLAKRRLTKKQKLVLEKIADLDGEMTMSALTSKLAEEMQIGKSTVRVILQALRDTCLISCGSSLNKGIAVRLTPVGEIVAAKLKLCNSLKNNNLGCDISELRNNIDIIDGQILNLVAERIKIAKNIGKAKKEKNIAVIDRKREAEVIKRWVKFSKNTQLGNSAAQKIAEDLIKICRGVQ